LEVQIPLSELPTRSGTTPSYFNSTYLTIHTPGAYYDLCDEVAIGPHMWGFSVQNIKRADGLNKRIKFELFDSRPFW
jgi:hypothetical protein